MYMYYIMHTYIEFISFDAHMKWVSSTFSQIHTPHLKERVPRCRTLPSRSWGCATVRALFSGFSNKMHLKWGAQLFGRLLQKSAGALLFGGVYVTIPSWRSRRDTPPQTRRTWGRSACRARTTTPWSRCNTADGALPPRNHLKFFCIWYFLNLNIFYLFCFHLHF